MCAPVAIASFLIYQSGLAGAFVRKMGQAVSAGLSGALLSIIGYTQATAFDPDVVNGIFNISTLVR